MDVFCSLRASLIDWLTDWLNEWERRSSLEMETQTMEMNDSETFAFALISIFSWQKKLT